MQRRSPTRTTRRPIWKERDLLDQKWVTYFLTFILILLLAVLIVSWKYRDWVVQTTRQLLHPEPPPPPRPRPGRVAGEWTRQPLFNFRMSFQGLDLLTVSLCALSAR